MNRGSWSRRAIAVVILAGASLSLGVSASLVYRNRTNIELAGYATAKALSDQIVIFRQVYARDLANTTMPATATQRQAQTRQLPVTMVKEIGATMARERPGSEIRVLSRYPFYVPSALDNFESEAIDHIEQYPDEAFYRIEDGPAGQTMRYAVADRMTPGCVQCHNTHPESPKRNWNVGDVRGIVEVMVPVEDLAYEIHRRELALSIITVVGSVLVFTLLLAFLRYDLRRRERERWALTDELTGLATRRAGTELLAKEAERARRHGLPLCFVLFDLDHFKTINDRHGHAAGDKTLSLFGAILIASVRTIDHPIRWGGEEFLVILPHTNLEQAAAFAERIRLRLADAPTPVPTTASAGIAQLQAGETPDAAIARADVNLYAAKAAGRNQVCADPVSSTSARSSE